MLLAAGLVTDLEKYIDKANDPTLLVWLGQYNEGRRMFDAALAYYSRAGDHVSCVRMHCLQVRPCAVAPAERQR